MIRAKYEVLKTVKRLPDDSVGNLDRISHGFSIVGLDSHHYSMKPVTLVSEF